MPTTKRNLIVFCPGYTGLPPKTFNPLLRRLEKDGFKTISINYKLFGRGDITDTARRVVKVINSLDKAHYDHITLIGHSMGGLVARKALSIDPSVADALVTLGSPHKGTQAASRPFAWLGGKSVLQMKPDSIWSRYCDYPDVPTLTVTGVWDFLVRDGSLPENAADVIVGHKNSTKNITVPTNHLGLIAGYRTYGEVYSWLVYEQMNALDPLKG